MYVVARAFKEWGGPLFGRLPEEVKDHLIDAGVCHFMTVFKTPDGKMTMFDFGPQGGDIRITHGPFKGLLGGTQQTAPVPSSSSTAAPAPGSRGEIRESELTELPLAHLYVGRTRMSLADIRSFNAAQALRYELHRNDCRHYVNSLVRYATGLEGSTAALKRAHYARKNAHKVIRWNEPLIGALALSTEVDNWEAVKATGSATAGMVLALTGRSTMSQLRTVPLQVVPAAARALPTVAKAHLAIARRRPVASTAFAATAAAAAWRDNPLLKEACKLGERMARGGNALLRAVGRAAVGAARSGLNQGAGFGATAASATSALATTAGRRAVSAMLAQKDCAQWAVRLASAGGRGTQTLRLPTAKLTWARPAVATSMLVMAQQS